MSETELGQDNWEWFEDPDDQTPDFENCTRIKFNLSANEERVVLAASTLLSGMGGNKKQNVACMAAVLLNLYRCHDIDPEKWVVYVRRKGNYKMVFRYNRNRIAWTSLLRVIDGLIDRELVEFVPGVYYRNGSYDEGRCSRIRAKGELIALLEGQYGFTKDVAQDHPEEEVIILKDADKNPAPYDDNNHNQANRKRTFVRQYNEFLNRTYLDIDADGFRPKKELSIDLSRRSVYRVFNNGSFFEGGRFYGGWWEHIPSALRLRIIINNLKVVEFDYSGVHIHLLYAKNGLDYSKLGKDAYQLPEYAETTEMRRLFKELLLAALNAAPKKDKRGRLMSGEERAVKALRQKIRFKPDDYPEDLPDLKEAMHDFGEYHHNIKHHFYSGVGLKLMYTDSLIAEDVLRTMMDKSIPVLPVHDSFVCPKLHENELYQVMKESYQKHCNFDISKRTEPTSSRWIIPGITIKEDELDRQIEYPTDTDVEYHYDINTIKEEGLLKLIMQYDDNQLVETDIQITVKTDGTVRRRQPSLEEG